ncbi:hypothetical protein A2154_00735 [Candidatus Gottesmanbacteria bacterium RBG_16_43_7]|uniref:Large ribosomal subunit protein bL25 n=1 Tax=Candidatus Gottesmanbacteria bacterium RBG_16_43_7 TaxID=1798373 RepID=A0A1F5Z923_9BACT|nr:MAG: hypothetical protein A2154_00735 [Candidatus Gottesmanbacteria bacterium RBG_16_43_7]
MKTYTLTVEPRTVFGRKTKNLRRDGIIPATIYGKKIKSESVQVSRDAFMKIYQSAGETGLVELSLSGSHRPVLIHATQTHPVTDAVLHAEFHQVDLKEKVKADIPIISIGTPAAVSQKTGLLIQTLNDLEVAALPADLPENIEVDVSALSQVDDQIRVADLKLSDNVEVLTAADQSVFRIVAPVKQEEPPPAVEPEAVTAEDEAAVDKEQKPEGAEVEKTDTDKSDKAAI